MATIKDPEVRTTHKDFKATIITMFHMGKENTPEMNQNMNS